MPRSSERGAAAVEFALVLPLLVLLVVGITTVGRAFWVQTTLSNAAREGVRAMALQNSPASAKAAAKNAAAALNLTDSQIDVKPTSCPSPGTASPSNASVTITYPLTLLGGGALSGSITLKGKGVMRCSG